MKLRRALLMICLATTPLTSLAGDCPELDGRPLPKERVHLYLLIGQSNMAGRGVMDDDDRQPVAGVFMLDAENRWQPARHPLHFDRPSMAGVGLGLDFARTMLEHDRGTGGGDMAIGLIPSAMGGTRLSQWLPGEELYEQAVTRTNAAKRCGVLKGVLWHQGESDAKEGLARSYAKRLSAMIEALRNDLGEPELPFVMGEIGQFRIGVHGQSDVIIEQLQDAPRLVPRSACVSSAGLDHKGDFTHFDAKSLKEFGRRYAAAMIELQSAPRSN